MPNHKCPRCGYNTTNKSDLRKHYLRKTLCSPTLQDINLDEEKEKYLKDKEKHFECSKCHKKFETKQGWQKHEEKCTNILPPLKNNSAPSTSNGITKEMIQLKDYIISELKKEFGDLLKHSTIVNKIENIENIEKIEIKQQNNIIISNFGAEDIKYIYDDINFMKSCFMNYEKGLIQFILKKWFDKDHPENHNIRMIDIKNAVIEYYELNRWNKSKLDTRLMEKLLHYVGFEYQRFLEISPVFDKSFLDNFMKRIGYPLEWDLSHDEYDYDEKPLTENECNQIKDKLHSMVKKDIFSL